MQTKLNDQEDKIGSLNRELVESNNVRKEYLESLKLCRKEKADVE